MITIMDREYDEWIMSGMGHPMCQSVLRTRGPQDGTLRFDSLPAGAPYWPVSIPPAKSQRAQVLAFLSDERLRVEMHRAQTDALSSLSPLGVVELAWPSALMPPSTSETMRALRSHCYIT